jgi:hypothetical protein
MHTRIVARDIGLQGIFVEILSGKSSKHIIVREHAGDS